MYVRTFSTLKDLHGEATTNHESSLTNETHTDKCRRKRNSAILGCCVARTTATIDLLVTILR